MTRFSAFVLAFAASLTLATAPVLAQTAPMSGDMKGTNMAKPAKKAAKPMKSGMKKGEMKTAMSSKRTCMDYAYGSQDEKDCEAGKIKPPTNR